MIFFTKTKNEHDILTIKECHFTLRHDVPIACATIYWTEFTGPKYSAERVDGMGSFSGLDLIQLSIPNNDFLNKKNAHKKFCRFIFPKFNLIIQNSDAENIQTASETASNNGQTVRSFMPLNLIIESKTNLK